jgi:histidinol-phosphatase (PHP family)
MVALEKWDGHTHTHFCRHGSTFPMEDYIEKAIERGFTRYSITEHPPLPKQWVSNPQLMSELAMDMVELPDYLDYAWKVKQRYADRIDIAVGLEFDYLPGNTDFTLDLVDRWEKKIEDTIVSVHYLPGFGGIRCIDFKPDDFQEGILRYYGTMEKVVDEYFTHIEQAIELAAKLPMRSRIGHINLIEKFHTALPEIDPDQMKRNLLKLLPKLAASGVGIDVNTAGSRVTTCGRPYVPVWFIQECQKQNISCVYGSDAHKPEFVGFGWDYFEQAVGK